MANLTLLSLAGLIPEVVRRRATAILLGLRSVLSVTRGWYFESAEAPQSRYGFSDSPASLEDLTNRVRSVQRDHKDLVAGTSR